MISHFSHWCHWQWCRPSAVTHCVDRLPKLLSFYRNVTCIFGTISHCKVVFINISYNFRILCSILTVIAHVINLHGAIFTLCMSLKICHFTLAKLSIFVQTLFLCPSLSVFSISLNSEAESFCLTLGQMFSSSSWVALLTTLINHLILPVNYILLIH